MLNTYFKVAKRVLDREKIYVFINVLSLALGISCFAILSLYLRSELTYDKHHLNHDRINRIVTKYASGLYFAAVPEDLGPMLAQDYPQLGTPVRFYTSRDNHLTFNDKRLSWDKVYFAENAAFKVFTHGIKYGDPEFALLDPDSIAISETVAEAYFGNDNPVGKIIEGDNNDYRIDLVFEDLPENTHLKYDVLMGYRDRYPERIQLESNNVYTYFHVTPEFDSVAFPEMFMGFMERHMKERFSRDSSSLMVDLQPLSSIHFGEKILSDQPYGNIFYIFGFSAVAIFILSVAIINYINLSTARATKRADEVALRKVLGASRFQLINQFLGEALVFAVLALLLALLIVPQAMLATPIGALMDKGELFRSLGEPFMLVYLTILTLCVGVLSGLYPAFYLSSLPSIGAIKKVSKAGKSVLPIRQTLVFVQLTISISVIACTLVMASQLDYLSKTPLGFSKNNRLIVTVRGMDVIDSLPVIKTELSKNNNILSVTWMAGVLGGRPGAGRVRIEDNEGVIVENGIAFDAISVGPEFIQAMEIGVAEGRAFSEEYPNEQNGSIIVNEELVKFMGWENPIGKRMSSSAERPFRKVVGVTKNFHNTTLYNEVGPLMIFPLRTGRNISSEFRATVERTLIINVGATEFIPTMGFIRETMDRFDPNKDYYIEFLEDSLNQHYRLESNLMKLSGIFSAICIFISIIGLYGLASFNAEQRGKEMTIHKVMGASSNQIVYLLSRSLPPMIMGAAIPATVLSYYVMENWLQNFAYRTEITAAPFMIAIVSVAVVTLATVMMQSFKIASANPVEALRYE